MKEELLHFIWQQKFLLSWKNLKTQTGETIVILYPGNINNNSGPDFFNAKIKINDDIWVGNVEIHIKSSDWFRHQHQHDPAYENVILHVVFEDDAELPIPTIELKSIIPESILSVYKTLQLKTHRVPCQKILTLPDALYIEQFMSRLSVERLEDKCTDLYRDLETLNNNWDLLFYHTLSKYFGTTINAEPFSRLASCLPPIILARHKHNRTQIDSLILGTAGFLPPYSSHWYTNLLIREFGFLKRKYQLTPLPVFMWKFARTRPANFPTLRLAQFAALLHQSSSLFSQLMLAETPAKAAEILKVSPSLELDLNSLHHVNHSSYRQPGTMFLNHLIINVVIPIKFVYGRYTFQEHLCEQSLKWLEKIPVEQTNIVNFWKSAGINAQHALHSQALIQLRKQYCVKQRCLECTIGKHILNSHA